MALLKPNSNTSRIQWADSEPQVFRLSTNKAKPAACRMTSFRSHLPVCKTTEYNEGEEIFGEANPSQRIYLLVAGMVEISQTAEGASGVLVEIIRPDELFGESAFLTEPYPSQQATALEDTTLMAWTISDVKDQISKRPQLAVALLEFFAQRHAEVGRRIESLSLDTIEQRLARTLIRLSGRLGTPEGEGYVRMAPLTHELLSRYVGTSSDVVTQCMNRFRKQGYVSDSQCGTVICLDPFQKLLAETVKKPKSRRRGA
jgi:CRP-like cAMP-binding protein